MEKKAGQVYQAEVESCSEKFEMGPCNFFGSFFCNPLLIANTLEEIVVSQLQHIANTELEGVFSSLTE